MTLKRVKKPKHKNVNKNQTILHGLVCCSTVVWLCSRTAALPSNDHQGVLRMDWVTVIVWGAQLSHHWMAKMGHRCYGKHNTSCEVCCFLLADNCESAMAVCWIQQQNVAYLAVSVLPLLHLLSYFGSSTLDIRLWICVSGQKSHSRLWDYAHTLNLFFCRDSSLIFGAAQSVFHHHSRRSVFSASPCLQVLPDYDMFLPSLKVLFMKHARNPCLFDAAVSTFSLSSFNFPLKNWCSGKGMQFHRPQVFA